MDDAFAWRAAFILNLCRCKAAEWMIIMAKLSDLPNIGKVVEERLIQAGINTPEELRATGAGQAWLMIMTHLHALTGLWAWRAQSGVCVRRICLIALRTSSRRFIRRTSLNKVQALSSCSIGIIYFS